MNRTPLMNYLYIAVLSTLLIQQCLAFGPPCRSILHSRPSSTTRVFNSERNQFDVTKPTFDLYSFRLIRSDALLRYNSLNQSEPLRINLFLLATISLLGYPLWCESVTGDVPTVSSELGAAGVGVACAALFWRERTRRSNQLRRMEKELNAGSLSVRLPVNKAITSVRPEACLIELRSKRRVVAIRGSKEQLQSSGVLDTLCILRRRLIQSQTLVVLIPTDGTTSSDWGLNDEQLGDTLWLADASNMSEWKDYFKELLGDTSADELAWFALNFNGRSIASGFNEAPRLFELLGQQLQPMEILDENDEARLPDGTKTSSIGEVILEIQAQFYNILTDSNDESKMQSVFSEKLADEVNEVGTVHGFSCLNCVCLNLVGNSIYAIFSRY